MEFIDKSGIELEWMNIGGGFGIDYGPEKAVEADKIAAVIMPIIKGRGFKTILEPGRFIMGNSGILVSKVIYIKTFIEQETDPRIIAGLRRHVEKLEATITSPTKVRVADGHFYNTMFGRAGWA